MPDRGCRPISFRRPSARHPWAGSSRAWPTWLESTSAWDQPRREPTASGRGAQAEVNRRCQVLRPEIDSAGREKEMKRMAIGSAEPVKTDIRVDVDDLVHTGPSTIAGRFLRTFWMPAYRSEDVTVGRAKPLRIMDEDLTLYRGESGSIHAVAFRCAHRGTQLNTGWVEGENIRCFYHGWVYDGAGR